jgi:hypothetical protein
MYSEYLPLVAGGYRPPLAEGFSGFLRAPQVVEATGAAVDHELKEGGTEPFDSHPSLRERLGALQPIPPLTTPDEEGTAASLLADVGSLEAQLVRKIVGAAVASAKPVRWDDVGARAWPSI